MVDIINIKYQRTFQNSEVAGNGIYKIPIPENAINTHSFFNECIVVNTSSSDIKVTPDNDTDRVFICPAKGSFGWSFKDDNFKFSRLQFEELNGNIISANTVSVIVAKKRFKEVSANAEY